MTVETTATLSAEDARTLVDRVRGHVEDVRGALIRLWSGRAWLALGYATWDDLCDAEFAVRIALPREQRREVVAELRSEGMSTRAIGSALGVAPQTVVNDLDRLSTSGQSTPETVTSLDGRSRPAHVTTTTRTTEATKVEQDVDLETGEIAGPDFAEPVSSQAKRRPLPDAFVDAVDDLGRDVARIKRLVTDDRFPRNAQQVATRNRSDLLRAAQTLSEVIEQMNHSTVN